MPEQRERISIFCSFAAPGERVERYIQYPARRGDYQELWKRSGSHQKVFDLAARRGVQIILLIPDYGDASPPARFVTPR